MTGAEHDEHGDGFDHEAHEDDHFLDDDPLADRDRPLEPEEHELQLAGLLAELESRSGDRPRRVLDLGCGGGRILVPLVEAGHEVVGMDRDPDAVTDARAAAASAGGATVVEGDLVAPDSWPDGPFDAVVCLGHTFVEIADVDDAVRALAGMRSRLSSDGLVVLDDLPGMLWPCVGGGDWIDGISDDGRAQLVWDRRDAVLTIRRGEAVDADAPELTASDTRWRIWTDGALRLAAAAAGLSAPEPRTGAGLLIMRPV